MIIRKMKKEDYKNIYKLALQVQNIHFSARPDIFNNGDPFTNELFLNLINDSNYICLVAEENNKILGECFVRIDETSVTPLFKERKILNINDICIDQNYRGKGIGKLLMLEIEKFAKELNAASVELNVWSFNKNAINFYNSLGFKNKSFKMEKFME